MKNRIVILIFIVLVCLSVIACAAGRANHEKASGHITVGMALIKSEMYTDALRELFAAEELTPNDPVVHYYLGIAYLGKNARDRAMKEFQKAVSLNPDYSEAHNYLGILYMEQQHWDLAISSFDRALANILYDTPSVSLYNKGWALYRKGDYKKALISYKSAARMNDALTLMPQIEKNMGLVLLALGENREALSHFSEAINLVPDFPEAQYWLALTNVRLKQYNEATQILQDMIQNKSSQSEYVTKGQQMLEQIRLGKYDELLWRP
ncbi:MAG: tetratricopeptide repeat protein [Syntrophaceae bacterium]|nr:tetratricopeptide repeat protein [Syntrophaceae bacterium]